MAMSRKDIENRLNRFLNTPNMTEEEAFSETTKLFEDLAPYLNVGHVEIEFFVPNSIFTVENVHTSRVIFESDADYDMDRSIDVTFSSAKDAHVDIFIYPIKDHIFTKVEEDELRFITNVFYNVICNIKYKMLMKDVHMKDPQTAGPNITAVCEFLYRLKAQNVMHNYNIIFLNLKNFSSINEIYGYTVCNEILKSYQTEINNIMGDNGIIGRLGGDNSLCVVRRDYFDEFVNRLKKVTLTLGNSEVEIESWLGCYEITEDDGPHDTIQYAHLANQYCKQVTREFMYIFSQNDKRNLQEEQQIRGDLIDDLSNNRLTTYYQPKVNIDNYKLMGCEALVRWFRNGNMVPNNKFIPIIEKSNLVCDLDFCILENVCKDIRNWCNEGIIPVRTSVNFSRNHVSHENTLDRILKTIDKYNIDPSFIEVELTELTYYRDFEKFAKFIDDLRSHGIPVSMDDFGSGYSSIALLEKAFYNIVKLDKSLVDSISDEKSNLRELIIVRSLIDMLKQLDVEIVAEGVETEKQINFLKNLGVNTIQGYYFDKPLPREEFTKRLINKQY